jgi:type VI protein secretion system component VasK
VRVAAMAAVLCSLATLLPFPSFLVILWRLVVLVAAGFIAVHWYQRRTGEWLNVKSGIRLGWMTGFFSYLIAVVLTVFAMAVISASEGGLAEFWRKQLAAAGGPESEEAMRILGSTEGIVFLMVLTFAAAFLIFTALPMIGGALGAKVLEKE